MKIVISILAILFSFQLQASSNVVEGLADQILQKTGSYEMIALFPDHVRAQAAQQSPFSVNQQVSEKIATKIISSFNISEANSKLLKYVSESYTKDELRGIIKWLDSPLGVRFSAAEFEAGSVEGQANLIRYAAELSTNPPEENRILIIQKYEEKAQLTDLIMDMMKTMMSGMAHAINSNSPESERLSKSEIDSKITESYSNMVPMMRQMMWQRMLVTSHYMYRDFSDEEMMSYINFLDTNIGKKYINLGEGMLDVFTDSFTNVLVESVDIDET